MIGVFDFECLAGQSHVSGHAVMVDLQDLFFELDFTRVVLGQAKNEPAALDAGLIAFFVLGADGLVDALDEEETPGVGGRDLSTLAENERSTAVRDLAPRRERRR